MSPLRRYLTDRESNGWFTRIDVDSIVVFALSAGVLIGMAAGALILVAAISV